MRSTLRVMVVFGLIVVLLAAAVGAGSQERSEEPKASPVLGPNFRICGPPATGNDHGPAVVWNASAGEYLVVWSDERNFWTGGSDIYGQRVSATGSPVGGNFRISPPGAPSDQTNPVVAWNGADNQYLVVWDDKRDEATRGWDIYGQRVSATGSRVGGELRLSGPDAIGDDLYPAAAWNGTANQYLVVWGDWRDYATRGADVYGQRVSAAGSRVGVNFRISPPGASSSERNPAVAWNGAANQYLVVWDDERDKATRGWDIYGQRVSATGSRVGGELGLSGPDAIGDDERSAVVWNGAANQYLVVWGDGRDYTTRGVDVYGQRVSATGSRVGVNFRVSDLSSTSDDEDPAVAWNGAANQYLVVWDTVRDPNTRGYEVYGQELTRAGSVTGTKFPISGPAATGDDENPAAAWNGTTNQYLVVWLDGRDLIGRGTDIYGQRVAG